MWNDCPDFAISSVTSAVDPTEETSKLASCHSEISKSGLSASSDIYIVDTLFTFCCCSHNGEAILSLRRQILKKNKTKQNTPL